MPRDEDIFKKLKKQTPLVKQKTIQPLSSRDFTPAKTTLNIPVEYAGRKRNTASREPSIFQSESERVNTRPAKREPVSQKQSVRAQHARPREKEPEVFGNKQSTVSRPAEKNTLDVFADNVKPQSTYAPEKSDIISPKKTYEPARRESATPQRSFEMPRTHLREQAERDKAHIEAVKPEGGFPLRHELKYYINYRDYVLLRSSLKALMSPDPFSGEDNSYHIRSLYFDDINDTALREKIAGSDYRRKYRIRIYNLQDDTIKFEKKYKVGQYIGKKSISLTRGEYDSLIAGEYDFLLDRKEELARELYLEIKGNLLRPRVIVDYVREAYVSPIENCRITFDKDLRGGLMINDIFDPSAPVMPMYESGLMVLEVKFNKYLPEFIKRVLNNINAADRCAISKYVICRKYD